MVFTEGAEGTLKGLREDGRREEPVFFNLDITAELGKDIMGGGTKEEIEIVNAGYRLCEFCFLSSMVQLV